ncbi:MAG: DNA polymerase III subunit delta' [Candidatus Omnitrophica bacterium]|nr:DNA polymerase III subunit delta' [Candidatus Omnitrophota bacterium]
MSFKDIKGQARAIEMLENSLRHLAIAGAYLFIGEEGIGKYLTAVNFAKAINCLSKDYRSCDSCLSCLKIEKKQHPDVHFIEPQESESIKIELMRDLKKEISFKPYEARKKVFIINNAHNLTDEAANALLKVLEEPPRDSLIILVTAKPKLLFKTIVSRCQTIKFSPLVRHELEETLNKDYHLDSLGAHFLAYYSEGRLGCALKMKEGNILKNKNTIIDGFEKVALDKKEDIRVCLNILASWFRDIYLVKAGLTPSQIINLDRKDELLKLTDHYSWQDLDAIFDTISDSLSYLEHNINTKLLLSNLKVQICRG